MPTWRVPCCLGHSLAGSDANSATWEAEMRIPTDVFSTLETKLAAKDVCVEGCYLSREKRKRRAGNAHYVP